MNRLFALIGATLVAAGCADRGVVDVSPQQIPQPSADATASAGGAGLTVMTWNVYYGTDPSIVLQGTTPEEIAQLAGQVWALAQHTNFAERAGAIARAIASKRPHLVGVQEAALWRTGDGSAPAENVVFDFLALLIDSLKPHGVEYVVAAVDATTDIELPACDQSGCVSVRLTDRDAVLARSDVQFEDPQADRYQAFFQLPIPGLPPDVGIYEGWSSVVATVGGRTYRFVSTHLEIQDLYPVQEAQATELIGLLQDETLPTILVGDFNSDAAGIDPLKATPTYGRLIDEGFVDSWLRPTGLPLGLTCCENDSLSNLFQTFNQRVDFIFTRNMPALTPAGTLVLGRGVLGDQRGDRTTSGLWPSDHGGVVASFLVPPAGPLKNVVTE